MPMEEPGMKLLYKRSALLGFVVTIIFLQYRVYWFDSGSEIDRLWREKRNRTKDTIISYSTSLWFLSRMDFAVNPHWDQSSLAVEEPAFTWWMSVHDDRDVRSPMKALFSAGVPRRREDESLQNRIVRCAVVGNSESILQHKFGKFIDQHTYVMRFNKAITENYEEHVGKRTTHHFSYPESSHENFSNDTAFVLVPFITKDLWWLAQALRGGFNKTEQYRTQVPKKLTCDVSKIHILHPEFLRYIYVNWLEEHKAASTGFIGLIYALHVCDHVNVFGFKGDAKGRWLHYFETSEVFSGQHYEHDDNREKNIMKMLDVEGVIRIYGL